MGVAWLEQPCDFSGHEAQWHVGIASHIKDGRVQVHPATGKQQYDFTGRAQAVQCSGQAVQSRIETRVLHSA